MGFPEGNYYDICGATISERMSKRSKPAALGGVIPIKNLDLLVDYDNLQKMGSIMGAGGLDRFDILARNCASADIINNFLQGNAHRDFNQSGIF